MCVCVRRDVCKSPKRAGRIPSFLTAALRRILAAVRIPRLILWSCVEKWVCLKIVYP